MESLKSDSNYWDEIFSTKEDGQLGWYEKTSIQIFEMLSKIHDWEKSLIFVSGVGTSNIADELLEKGAKLLFNDISQQALNKVKCRLKPKTQDVTFLCQDISNPMPASIPKVDIWIDRAVLHFLTNIDDVKKYFNNLNSILKKGGYAVFAEFAKNGAPKCAGLPLHRYSVEEISELLGESYSLINSFNHIYINPFGDPRPYIYALYKRVN